MLASDACKVRVRRVASDGPDELHDGEQGRDLVCKHGMCARRASARLGVVSDRLGYWRFHLGALLNDQDAARVLADERGKLGAQDGDLLGVGLSDVRGFPCRVSLVSDIVGVDLLVAGKERLNELKPLQELLVHRGQVVLEV